MTLEIEVTSRAVGGLRLIPRIPPLRPCRLEGRNGIGKSAVIRLLVLASGVQPYSAEPEAWRSLKRLVGSTSISISGLSGSFRRALLTLTPERWPNEPGEVGSWLGELKLDGIEAPVERLFESLAVVHLVGTERLVDTLNQQRTRFNTSLIQATIRLQTLEESRAELGDIDDELRFISPREALSDASNLTAAKKERAGLEKTLNEAKRKVHDLQDAMGLDAMLRAGNDSAEAKQRAALRASLAEAKSEQAQYDKALETALKDMAQGTQKQRSIGKAEAKLRDAQNTLEQSKNRQDSLGAHLADLGIDPGRDTLDDDELEQFDREIAVASTRQQQLQQQAMRNRRSEAENEIFDELRVVTSKAQARGLGELILFRINEIDISVNDMRRALGAFEPGPGVDDDELTNANQTLEELKELRSLVGNRAALIADVESARGALLKLRRGAKGHDNLEDRVAEARRLKDHATEKVREINSRIGALSAAGFGPADFEAAQTRINEILRQWHVERSELADQLMQSQASLTEATDRDNELQNVIAELTERAAKRRVARDAIRQKIRTRPSHQWIADVAAALRNDIDTDLTRDWSDDTWQSVADHIGRARKTITRMVREIEALQSVAATKGSTGSQAEALRSLIELDAREQLSTHAIAEALFDGGTVQRVDLESQSVTWLTGDGELRSRPLAAFSSGEQALGFMRARLQDVAAAPADNRLVFLDEFGAFIAADRRKPLAELLTSDSVTSLSDQVVVVLPLQADYAAELDETTGALHADYERRVAEVANYGYFTEELRA
ncbi:coiled-coil domain-containing protein [Mycobacteroides abscessus]|uniref:hypothetical protein n=1 Tax=Mycobacteroides abscessus TaxID=36809 RepID=UPI0005E30A79|nr:hypothetical protein [Mycobacteroides abscessus]MBE5511307.1 hypothetical protein [Mycobacteroides abscessus]MBN7385369.1 hypothetical protein [Mycobacteroides abscessus subsp. abscessus]MBN7416959.1 hypothetical protein [Mycobacteroides abscessus subsp. abscessus]MBN7486232.1 hypothetical protein [Mycobacteroides abscessus subsp. abscessus]MBN7501262.1 hypothetical protein [Mycobacteroides abscessus subsp. abscessus]